VVKGVSRRVIVVKTPDPKIFEEAIFIVREDILRRSGLSRGDILREAEKVADSYVRTHLGSGKKKVNISRLTPILYAAAGAVCAGLVFVGIMLL